MNRATILTLVLLIMVSFILAKPEVQIAVSEPTDASVASSELSQAFGQVTAAEAAGVPQSAIAVFASQLNQAILYLQISEKATGSAAIDSAALNSSALSGAVLVETQGAISAAGLPRMILYGDEVAFVLVSSFVTAVLATNLNEWLLMKRNREVLRKRVMLSQ